MTPILFLRKNYVNLKKKWNLTLWGEASPWESWLSQGDTAAEAASWRPPRPPRQSAGGHVACLLDLLQKPVRWDELVLLVSHGGSLGGQEIVDIGPGGSRHVLLDVHVSGPHTVFEAKLGRSGAEEQLSQPAVDIYCIGYGCRLHRETL